MNFYEIHLEIGCDKGDFLIQNSLQNQNILFISIEKYATVVLKALNKIKNNQIIAKNLFLFVVILVKFH